LSDFTRPNRYLEAVAYLLFTEQEPAARAFLEDVYPELAAHCRQEGGTRRSRTAVLSHEAGRFLLSLSSTRDVGSPEG
jgi:hypothetical protein